METNKKRLAQDIDIDNNPVNKDNDIIPEENKDNTDKNITEEETPIEQINNNKMKIDPKPPTPGDDNVIDTRKPKNTIRYIDSGFRF